MMKIIKRGTVQYNGRDFTFDGWEVEGGTNKEFQRYALHQSGLWWLAVTTGFFN